MAIEPAGQDDLTLRILLRELPQSKDRARTGIGVAHQGLEPLARDVVRNDLLPLAHVAAIAAADRSKQSMTEEPFFVDLSFGFSQKV